MNAILFDRIREQLDAPSPDSKDVVPWAEAAGRCRAAGLVAVMTAEALLEAAHKAADELDEWDGYASSVLGGMSPGGVVRHKAHKAAEVDVDTCPACQRRTEEPTAERASTVMDVPDEPLPPGADPVFGLTDNEVPL
ncbi:hypothetical protein [Nocardioides nitrophenolicus]|uniref:hypothetical protein n=1 Tax=Nocardioides nitrophenolicus TaxID=60489 RepID=UPI00195BA8B2|nr:hypothetical protein [Nocardioides nitrophenolicus]MBM7518294.1 hypothetical protein [Nocardioides nitrophenolicus]